MPSPGERLALLMKVHGDSSRGAGERCGMDHATIIRVRSGETENPATLGRIAEAYGVPLTWLQGEPDLSTDFAMAVLGRTVQERKRFVWDRGFRYAFALGFLRAYSPETYTLDRLAALTGLSGGQMAMVLAKGRGLLADGAVRRLKETGLPGEWLETGLLGREAERPLLVEMAVEALRELAEAVGADVAEDEIKAAALALV